MAETAEVRPIPFTVIVPTLYGQMMLNRNDINQTNALFKTGLAIDHQEIVLLAGVLRRCPANPVFVDVGANFGTYTMAMALVVGPMGRVHSFEPQRLIYNLLVGSVALNSFTNVFVYNMAVADREGSVEIPQFDYHKPLNFGSVEFTSEQREPLTQRRGHDPARMEMVPLTSIDRFNWGRVDMIKIDAEGMEPAVLEGAKTTISRCRPVLYVEFLKTDVEAMEAARLFDLDYEVFKTPVNFLAIPTEQKDRFPVKVKNANASSP